MAIPRRVQVPLDVALLDRARVPRAGAPAFPVPVWQRLDEMVAAANALGSSTNRQEVLGALICGRRPSGADLKTLVESYRTATVRTVLGVTDLEARRRTLEIRSAGRPPGR